MMYSMKKASELLGIPVVTIRAWENRYGVIAPERSEGGHRLLSDDDLAKLRFLKRQIENNGLKISEAVRLLRENEKLPSEPSSHPEVAESASHALADKLYADLVHFRTAQADETIDLAFALFDIEETYRRIFVPVLYRVGEDWESGAIGVAQEHFASETIMRRLQALFRAFPAKPQLPVVLAFCPEGERHHLGLLSFSLFLRKRGAEVLYLGPDTPFQGLDAVIREHGVSFVAASVTDSRHVDKLMAWIGDIGKIDPRLRFLIGGKAFDKPEARPKLRNVRYLGVDQWEDWQKG